jgi:hypothetical protein
MLHIIVPRLNCPFPTAINPYVEEANNHTVQWLRQFNLVSSENMLDYYLKEKYSWMVARMFPNAPYDKLCLLSDINTLLFLLDDVFDHFTENEELSLSGNKLPSFMTAFIEVLANYKTCNLEEHGPVFAALSNWWLRVTQITTSGWQKYFVDEIRKTFEAALWQTNCVSQGDTIPTSTEYLIKRRLLGAANIETALIDVAYAIFLPASIYEHPKIKRLTTLCEDIICVANDLFSFTKEDKHGDQFNWISIFQKEHSMSLHDSIITTAQLHDGLMDEFVNLSKQVQDTSPLINEQLTIYINSLETIIKGDMDWSIMDTKRYNFAYGTAE